jgi:hypothetical protein
VAWWLFLSAEQNGRLIMPPTLRLAADTRRQESAEYDPCATVSHVTQDQAAESHLPPLPLPSATPEDRADAVEARLLARVGSPPSLDDYRRAYASCGAPWPGDDEIRRLHPVAP